MLLKSQPYGKEFEVAVCPKVEGEAFDVISHKSLQDIHDLAMRGAFESEITVIKDNANHALVKCVITDVKSGFRVEEIGEKTKSPADTQIGKEFPVTSAATRAFDRAMIRILGFDGKFYSDAEIPRAYEVAEKADELSTDLSDDEPVDMMNVETDDSAEFCAIEDPEIIPDDTPVVTEEPIAEVIPEIADETVSVIADPGEYVLGSGKKKGQTLNAVYADKDGKSWLDFCLGGQYVKSEVKDAIVAFYASKGLTVDNGDAKFITTAKEYYNANISRFTK